MKDPRDRLFVWTARLVAGRHPLNPWLIILLERSHRGPPARAIRKSLVSGSRLRYGHRDGRKYDARRIRLFPTIVSLSLFRGIITEERYFILARGRALDNARMSRESRQADKPSLPRIVCGLARGSLLRVCHAF